MMWWPMPVVIGWAPVARSIIASRRKASTVFASGMIRTPSASGPRCTSVRTARRNVSPSAPVTGRRNTPPRMPHMLDRPWLDLPGRKGDSGRRGHWDHDRAPLGGQDACHRASVYRLGAAEVEVVARPPRPAPGDSRNASRCRCLAQILRWECITHDLEGWAVSAKAEQRPPLTIAAVGDLQLGDSSISLGYGFRSRYQGREDLGGLFDGVRAWLAAGHVFGKLGGSLFNPGLVPSQWHLAPSSGHPA